MAYGAIYREFRPRFDEGEEIRAETHLPPLTEIPENEFIKYAFKVAHGDVLVHSQPIHIVVNV